MQQEYNADLSLLTVITGALMCLSPTVNFQLELVLTMPETLSRQHLRCWGKLSDIIITVGPIKYSRQHDEVAY